METKSQQQENLQVKIAEIEKLPCAEGLGVIADAMAESICDGLGGTFEPPPELQRQLRVVMAYAFVSVRASAAAFLRGHAQFYAAQLLETEFKP
jgi:hypothetical protein